MAIPDRADNCRLNFRCTPTFKRRVVALAEHLGLKQSALLRRLVDEEVDRRGLFYPTLR